MRLRHAPIAAVALAVATAGAAASIDEILRYRTLDEVALSPDGALAVVVATAPSFDADVLDADLWLVETASGATRRLTASPRPDRSPRWSPDGRRIAFLSDRGGTTDVWVIDPRGGEAELLVHGEGEIESFAWLPDGAGVAFAMRDPETEEDRRRKEEKNDPILVDRRFRYARLYVQTEGAAAPRLLTPEDEHVNGLDVAGRRIVYGVQPTPEAPDGRLRSDLELVDLDTGERRSLVRRPGMDLSPRFSPDGKTVAFVSMDGREDWIGNYFVCTVSVAGGAPRNVSAAFDERVAGPLRWSADGRRIAFLGGEGTARRVWLADAGGGGVGPAGAFDEGRVVDGFDLGPGGVIALAASDPHAPAELELVAPGGESRRLTRLNGDYPLDAIGRTEILRYRADDGLELEGLVVRPVGFRPGTRYPLLVVVHGGPSGVFTAAFTPRRGAYPIHAFSEEGYLLFLPNPRGSGGYGAAFRRANVRDWGFGDYRDIMAGVDRLVELGLADPERMGVMGWSYGGFMTSWIVTQTDRFRAASIGAPVTNPYSFYGVTDIPEFMEAYFGGRPWDPHTDYLRHAPEHHVAGARTPALILHGEEDRRVPLSQGQAFYRALRAAGVTVEMVVYPRTPHGLREPKLIRDALERNLAWFDRWVGGASESAR